MQRKQKTGSGKRELYLTHPLYVISSDHLSRTYLLFSRHSSEVNHPKPFCHLAMLSECIQYPLDTTLELYPVPLAAALNSYPISNTYRKQYSVATVQNSSGVQCKVSKECCRNFILLYFLASVGICINFAEFLEISERGFTELSGFPRYSIYGIQNCFASPEWYKYCRYKEIKRIRDGYHFLDRFYSKIQELLIGEPIGLHAESLGLQGDPP